MGLLLPYDREGLDPRVAHELDQITAAIQTWAGKQDGAGKLIDVPYTSDLYQTTAGVWTVEQGDQRLYRYSVFQDLLYLRIVLAGTSTSAAIGNDLRINLPPGFRVSDPYFEGTFQWNADTAGVDGVGRLFGQASPYDNQLRLLRDVLAVSTSWPASETNTFNIQINCMIPVFRDA